MPNENRNLAVGTKLTAKYKGQHYVCLVEAAPEGEGVVYALQGGKKHKSPSSAGMEVMGGKAVNGWRFWTVEGQAPVTTTEPAEMPKPALRKSAKAKVIYRNPNQRGVAEGSTRWFCAACMKGFVVDGDTEPQVCPEGHRAGDAEFTAAPSAEAVAADKDEASGE